MSKSHCHTCASEKYEHEMKRGWTNCQYCSESCERSHVSDVHGSMPGGKLPRRNWIPHDIDREISNRWADS